MPSTTSIAISVTIPLQPSGLVRKAQWVVSNSDIWPSLGLRRVGVVSVGGGARMW